MLSSQVDCFLKSIIIFSALSFSLTCFRNARWQSSCWRQAQIQKESFHGPLIGLMKNLNEEGVLIMDQLSTHTHSGALQLKAMRRQMAIS